MARNIMKFLNKKILKRLESYDELDTNKSNYPTSFHHIYELIQKGLATVECYKIYHDKKNYGYKKINEREFLDLFEEEKVNKIRESFGISGFDDLSFTNLIGSDFVPLVGGAFNKQLYQRDYIRMHNLCFHAWNHDPIARRIVEMIHNFALSKDFKIVSGNEKLKKYVDENFDELKKIANFISIESIIYGEVFIEKIERFDGLCDFQLIDPSMIWEIVTIPENINKVLGYWQVGSTQYQIKNEIAGISTDSYKFIIREIPANKIFHLKKNCVSNEKRGRSDLFPILGYLKRLRDAINYRIIADQKASAWAIDTKVDGSEEDIKNYINSIAELGEMPPAGSEFVHSSKIERTYLSPSLNTSTSQSFEWTLSMIAIGCGLPISYFGTHLSGGQTRASALVSTEPSVKVFEEQQNFVKKVLMLILNEISLRLGINKNDFEIIMPEIYSTDVSSKLRDLSIAQSQGWLSKKKAAEIAAKELGVENYNYEEEKRQIELERKEEEPQVLNPFTQDGVLKVNKSNLTSEEKNEIMDNYLGV